MELRESILRAVRFALTAELNATPKPGLVDKRNSGSHCDMDYGLMLESIDLVCEGIGEFLSIVDGCAECDAATLAKRLRLSGIQRESLMKERLGVNTHNGALFALGLAAVAAYRGTADSESIASLARGLTAVSGTKGAAVADRYGLKGAMYNAQDGYGLVFGELIPYFLQKREIDFEQACVCTLLKAITLIDDTNLYVRGGSEGALWARDRVGCLLAEIERDGFDPKETERLDDEFIARRLSPGGSADMLALTVFLVSVNGL